jgi:hypothetical protein
MEHETTRAWAAFREKLGTREPSERLFRQLLRTLRPHTRGDVGVLTDTHEDTEFANEIRGLAPAVFDDLLWGGATRLMGGRGPDDDPSDDKRT